MRVHVTTLQGDLVEVRVSAEEETTSGEATTTAETTGPNPISPEGKELVWGAGSFLVFLVIMRVFLFPKLKKGMDARYNGIREDFEQADATRLSAKTDVSKYEAALAEVRAEAAARVDKARQTLDQERSTKIAEANARIASKRSAADAEISAARMFLASDSAVTFAPAASSSSF